MIALAMLLTAAVLAPSPARVQVAADEFSFALSRQSLRSGAAIVQLANYGEDDHDLALRLVPGRYTLWCTLADHRRRGMHATLVVRAR